MPQELSNDWQTVSIGARVYILGVFPFDGHSRISFLKVSDPE